MRITQLIEEFEINMDFPRFKRELLLVESRTKEIIGVSRCILCSNTGNVQQEHDSDPKVKCSFCKTKELI